MPSQLSPEEKQLIEREFVAKQEVAARRRLFARRLFIAGMIGGIGSSALREFHVGSLAAPLLGIVWGVSMLAYVGAGIFPGTFAKDVDLRWHTNPWRDALQHLAEGRTQVEAITLLASPTIARMLFSFIYLAFR